MKYAEISDDVVVVGASYRAEIWSKANWEKFSEDALDDDILSALDDIVL